MRFGTLNIYKRNSRADARHDAELMAEFSTVILWQEVRDRHYRGIRDGCGDGWAHSRTYGKQPISWRTRDWDLVAEGRYQASAGWSGFQPRRFTSWVLLRNRHDGKIELFLNAHRVNGAWKHRRNRMLKWRWKWRQKQWLKHHAADTEFVARQLPGIHRAWFGGDLNRRNVQAFVDGMQVLMNGGIDALFVAGEPVEIVKRTTLKGVRSDHPGRVAKVRR